MARRHTRFIRPAPRTKMWIGAGVSETVITASTKHFISSLSAAALLLRPFTILRTHMDILYVTDTTSASETLSGIYGRIVVTDTASGIGVTAVPSPLDSPEADWFVDQAMTGRQQFADATGFGMAGHHYTIDSKAMRKVGPDDDIVAMFDQFTATGALLVTLGRTLIQLH